MSNHLELATNRLFRFFQCIWHFIAILHLTGHVERSYQIPWSSLGRPSPDAIYFYWVPFLFWPSQFTVNENYPVFQIKSGPCFGGLEWISACAKFQVVLSVVQVHFPLGNLIFFKFHAWIKLWFHSFGSVIKIFLGLHVNVKCQNWKFINSEVWYKQFLDLPIDTKFPNCKIIVTF